MDFYEHLLVLHQKYLMIKTVSKILSLLYEMLFTTCTASVALETQH